jgi:hypothetical protein
MFERFGWERIGGTAYRYPSLDANTDVVEDWLNQVVPAIMLFRSYLSNYPQVKLRRFSLHTSSSVGVNASNFVGRAVVAGSLAANSNPSSPGQFGMQKLEAWLDGIPYPY